MMKMSGPIAAVLIPAADWRTALAWYQKAFPTATLIRFESSGWCCLNVEGVNIECVPADEKVSTGPAGTVVYWSTADFGSRKAHLESLGATLYRGPMRIEADMLMCQLKDPWGNLIGIRGPEASPK